MTKRLIVSLVVFVFLSILLQGVAFAQSRLEYPNDVGLEIGVADETKIQKIRFNPPGEMRCNAVKGYGR